MEINTEHIHHWINAIRISNNPMRTMDAFWSGQIKSKEWLIKELENLNLPESTIEIHGGWVGVLASMLFQSKVPAKQIISIDIDPHCQHIAEEMNRIEHNEGRFKAEVSDMTTRHPISDIVINTSFEHIEQEQYDVWLNHMFDGQLIVLQSNNYSIEEHVRIAKDLAEFKTQSKLSTICYEGELDLLMYKRFMLIGYK